MSRTWFPLAFALAVLAVLLAAPHWLRPAGAQEDGELEDRIEQLEYEVQILSANLGQLYGGVLPPPLPVDASGVIPFGAFSGPSAFALARREGTAVTAAQRMAGVPWVCVRPVSAVP